MFNNLSSLLNRFSQLGAVQAFCKPLAENDNSKQQIYLGGSMDVLQMFPFQEIEATAKGKDSTYKAKLNFSWITESSTEQASGAQLILYPQYPEVRLSGFLRGCKYAPSEYLRPVPANQRRFNNGTDGRILFFATTKNGETLAYLATADSTLAQEFRRHQAADKFIKESVFLKIPLQECSSKIILLEKLAEIRDFGWQPSVSLDKTGIIKPYKANNGGGYTLEALFGIPRNASGEPDFMGWELKGYSSSKVSLITTEPKGGFYKERGIEAFVRRYGKPTKDDTIYFTGLHKANCKNETTGLTLVVSGFNATTRVIEDVKGAVELVSDTGECAAAWGFEEILAKWNKKHAQAAYVPYESNKATPPCYQYSSPTLLGEGTNFNLYLSALSRGLVVFDPGTKLMNASSEKPTFKPRSQFRVSIPNLRQLYHKFQPVEF